MPTQNLVAEILIKSTNEIKLVLWRCVEYFLNEYQNVVISNCTSRLYELLTLILTHEKIERWKDHASLLERHKEKALVQHTTILLHTWWLEYILNPSGGVTTKQTLVNIFIIVCIRYLINCQLGILRNLGKTLVWPVLPLVTPLSISSTNWFSTRAAVVHHSRFAELKVLTSITHRYKRKEIYRNILYTQYFCSHFFIHLIQLIPNLANF